MRRAIAAAVMGGLVLEGAVAAPSFAATHGAVKAPAAAKPASNAMKTVVYEGYEFQVPANWPVYRLDEHPQTCVRYDVHAVYLGKPGPNMRCPAEIVGRTQTVSLIPGVAQHTAQRELSVALGATAQDTTVQRATIIGTYGTDPAVIEHVLNTLHLAPADAVQTAQTGPASTQGAPAGKPASSSWPGVPTHWPIQIVAPPPKPKPFHPVSGFDTCAAPSLNTMHIWRSHYAAIGVYIGGVNYACAYGNLSASWVRTVTSSGWGLLPAYVGPQAPCWNGTGVTINPGKAAAEGKATAMDAVHQARHFGLAAGSPIYYDMEAYSGAAKCTTAVLQFLNAWDRQVAADRYVTGVYSSQDSGITDIDAAATARHASFTRPDAIWIALWDNHPTLNDGKLVWPMSDRAKQYAGNVNATVRGITLNVDKDLVGGPVARLPPSETNRNQFA